jgi:hypothetical protein
LDRYAPRCGNFVLVVLRMAVPGARSAPKRHWQPAKGSAGISRGGAPWLVDDIDLMLDDIPNDAGTASDRKTGSLSLCDQPGERMRLIRSILGGRNGPSGPYFYV